MRMLLLLTRYSARAAFASSLGDECFVPNSVLSTPYVIKAFDCRAALQHRGSD